LLLSKAGISVKPELEWNIKNLTWDSLRGLTGIHLTKGGKVGGVSNHVGITKLVASSLGELVPDVEPRIVFVFQTKPDYILSSIKKYTTHYHLVVERLYNKR
jgi:hypothetical protein